MKIIGVGIGPGMLTAQAIEAIQQAEVVYGSPRALELAAGNIRGIARKIEDYTRIHELPDNAVVLSTGDPNLSGLGKYARTDDVIIPGISSLQVACARLKIDLTDVVVITAHGRDPTQAIKKFKRTITSGVSVFLLPSPDFGVMQVASNLLNIYLDVPIAVLERLGYPDEHVNVGTAKRPPAVKSRLYCVMVGPAVKLDRN
jgi:cobalt-precorrin-7 (C5)-methyltransferase